MYNFKFFTSMEDINRAIGQLSSVSYVPPNTEVIFYFGGHGKPNGSWEALDESFKREYVEIANVFGLLKNHLSKELHFTLIVDSCCSGTWVEVLQQLVKDGDSIRDFSIGIQASCTADEGSSGQIILPILFNETLPSKIVLQSPCFFRTPKHKEKGSVIKFVDETALASMHRAGDATSAQGHPRLREEL